MFSRRHPVAIGGWDGNGWAWRGALWVPVLLLIVGLIAVLLPAGSVAGYGNEAGRSFDLTYPLYSLTCYGVYHVVRAGESIYSIARIYGSTAYRIRYCNGLASYTVYTGHALLVPIYRAP